MSDWKPVTFTLIPFLGFGNALIYKKEFEWYEKEVVKPSWHPPMPVNIAVGAGFCAVMGYSSYLIYRDGGGFEGDAKYPLALYGAHLALDLAHPTILFGSHNFLLGAINITAITGCVAGLVISYHSINKDASHMMMPYLGWMGFATALSWWMWKHNKAESTEEKKEE